MKREEDFTSSPFFITSPSGLGLFPDRNVLPSTDIPS
jgi:hypothetical protein